jgi:hypothetical protein
VKRLAKQIDTAALSQQATSSIAKEAYLQLEKTQAYRIGVGARATLPTNSSFFVEINFSLSSEDGKVDLQRLENILACLKALEARGYTLTYDDSNCISCETKENVLNPNEEYREIKVLIEHQLMI